LPAPLPVINGRKFGRLPQFDQRSRAFPIRALVPEKPRSYTWKVGVYLDQGQEGACVGFGWAHELVARPVVVPNVTEALARDIYHKAQILDEYTDTPPEEGTSVIAGAQVVHGWGFVPEYRWAFGLQDLILAVGHHGPAVAGVNWYDGMFDTDSAGFIHVTGQVAGGHCVCIPGVNVGKKYFRGHNNWGKSWGVGGDFFISFDDMERLLHEQGEACIPVRRSEVGILA